jgi:DNA mismatch repair protein MLH1
MKRAIEAAFVGSLPKSACPFVYLSLLLPPHTVDVNVHPTKREVHFLDEEAIIEKIADAMQTVLVKGEGAKSRVFEYQVGPAYGRVDDSY